MHLGNRARAFIGLLVVVFHHQAWSVESNASEFNRRFRFPKAYFVEHMSAKDLKTSYLEHLPALPIVAKKAGVYRAVTYNVHHWSNLWQDEPLPQDEHIDRILLELGRIDADIFGLQEVVWDEYTKTKTLSRLKLSPEQAFFCEASQWPGRPFGNLLISRFPIQEAKCLPLPGNNEEGRAVLWSLVSSPNGPIQIVVSHLDYQGGADAVRTKQLETILGVLDKRIPMLLLADTNTVLSSEMPPDHFGRIASIDSHRGEVSKYQELQVLKNGGLVDAFEGTKTQAPLLSCWSHRRTDFIFSDQRTVRDITGIHVHSTPASDHLPIYLDLLIKNKCSNDGGLVDRHVSVMRPVFDDPRQQVLQIQNVDYLKDVIGQLKIHQNESYVSDIALNGLARSAKLNPGLFEGYFGRQNSLTEVLQYILKINLDDLKGHNDVEKADKAFGPLEEDLDKAAFQILSEANLPENLNILSFGCGPGLFEKRLKDFLLRSGKVKTVTLWGYDPYQKVQVEDVQILTLDQLASLEQKMDVFLMRWVLHHFDPAVRWQALDIIKPKLAPQSFTLLLEQGVIKNTSAKRMPDLFYELLAGVYDLVANTIYCPDWFLKNERFETFTLEFLTHSDFEEIGVRLGLKRGLWRLELTGDGFVEAIYVTPTSIISRL